MKTELLSEVKDTIKTGDLIAFRVRRYDSVVSLVLKAYQFVAGAEFSHVGIALRNSDGIFIVEATPPRVTITPLHKVDDFYLVRADVQATEESQKSFLYSKYGVRYSLVDMFTHYIGMDFKKDSLYCSEFASEFYTHSGFLRERESGHTPDKITKAVREAMGGAEPIHVIVDRGSI